MTNAGVVVVKRASTFTNGNGKFYYGIEWRCEENFSEMKLNFNEMENYALFIYLSYAHL
jgi:hypothetical protein